MTKFTNILPANYESDHTTRYALYRPPVPDAETVDWRMVDKQWVKVMGPDMATRAGDLRVMQGFMLGGYHQQNIDGAKWVWMPMADFVALMEQPAPVATDDGERERLQSSIRTAMGRLEGAYGLLGTAFEDLQDGLLEGKEEKP